MKANHITIFMSIVLTDWLIPLFAFVWFYPSLTEAKLYNCEKNGTITISSEPCHRKKGANRHSIKRHSQYKTCFLENLKTLEQSLVSNPTPKQIKLSRVIWCEEKDNVSALTSHRTQDKTKSSSTAPSSKTEHLEKKAGRSLPKRALAFREFVERAAKQHQLPEALLWAFMKVESDFVPTVVSRVGAQGLMQLMPFTSKDMGVNDPFDPEQNIFGAAKLIRILMDRFKGELPLVISAYHAGGGAVTKKEGIPYTQTSQYMTSVLNAYYRYMKRPPYLK